MKQLLLAIPLFIMACESPASPPVFSSSPIAPSVSPGTNPCIKDGQVYCAINLDVKGDSLNDPAGNFASTICKSGWTKTVRPSVQFTDSIKLKLLAIKGLGASDASRFELDHRIPLELGGAPGSPLEALAWQNINLALESPGSPNPKDSDETALKVMVCRGQLTLTQARQELVDKWLGPGDQYKR